MVGAERGGGWIVCMYARVDESRGLSELGKKSNSDAIFPVRRSAIPAPCVVAANALAGHLHL